MKRNETNQFKLINNLKSKNNYGNNNKNSKP